MQLTRRAASLSCALVLWGWLPAGVVAEEGLVELVIKYPSLKERVPPDFEPSFALIVDHSPSFIAEKGESTELCFELFSTPDPADLEEVLSGRGTTWLGATCVDLFASDARVTGAPAGAFTLKAWLRGQDQSLLGKEAYTQFRVVSDTELAEERGTAHYPWEALLEWYRLVKASAAVRQEEVMKTECLDPRLVVGIKSAAGHFVQRQALRETWMSSFSPGGLCKDSSSGDSALRDHQVHAWFIVGETESALLPEDVQAALALERRVFGDVLTSETGLLPPVPDSYLRLVSKTKTFLKFAADKYFSDTSAPQRPFLMILDDDTYVRLPELLEALLQSAPRERFYAGQVWEEQVGHPIRPQRDPRAKNYLPIEEWPARNLPPFAIGPHYLLSPDCVSYIASNYGELRGVGTLEDVSVAVWMDAIGVKPMHLHHFVNAKNGGCVDFAVSLTDLTPASIRALHDNVQRGLTLCQGWPFDTWSPPNSREKF